MKSKIYLNFFILCCICSQGISILSKENNDKSENLHIRKKRLFDETPGGNKAVPINHIPYIVSIVKNDRHIGAGSILASNIVITAAQNVIETARYNVLSGSSHAERGTRHTITNMIFYPQYSPARQDTHDFVLLLIHPFIDFHRSLNRPIPLHGRNIILLGTDGYVSGWGSNTEIPNDTHHGELRSVLLPTIGIIMCRNIYKSKINITEQKFCTHDICSQKGCGPGDIGNPYVFNQHLVGLHIGYAKLEGGVKGPDVFVNLCDPEYNNWIHLEMRRNPPTQRVQYQNIPLRPRAISSRNPHNHHNL